MSQKELSIVRQLLNEFNDKVLYCHWKSNQHFDDALIGIDDLDILIDRRQYGVIVNILQKLEFKRFYIPAARTYVGIEDYIGFDYETGKLIHLHLHSQLVVGEKHLKGFLLPFENMVLKNRRWDSERAVYMSSFFDELLLLIVRLGMKVRKRDVVKSNCVTGSTKCEFEWLKDNCNEFVFELENQTWCSERIKAQIIHIYNKEIVKWTDLNKLKKYLYSDLSCYSQGSGIYNTLKRNYKEFERIILEINKRFLKSKFIFTRRRSATGGIIVAFLGSDGAGKSTTIKEIYNWLFQFMDVRLAYLGSGDGSSSVLRKPLSIGLKIAQKFGLVKKSNNFSNEKLVEVTNKNLSFARRLWVYVLSLERINKIRCLHRCKIRGYVVLTDRYPQGEFDGLCDGRRLRGQGGFAEKKEIECFKYASLCPPDLVIKMIVPPEIAIIRKPGEINIETSKNLTERVRKLKFSEFTTSVEIDSSKNRDEVILDVKRVIWKSI